jgi:hypothetical protein
MSSTVAAEPVLDAVVTAVRALLAGRLFEVSGGPTPKHAALEVFESVADQRTTTPPPYVIVGGGTTERPFNTMGPADGPKFGSVVLVPIRVVTQYPTTERQTHRMMAAIKAGLDGQRIPVSGYGTPIATFEDAQMLTDAINGVPTYELVADVDLTVHQ